MPSISKTFRNQYKLKSGGEENTIWNTAIPWKEKRKVKVSNNVIKPATGEFQVRDTSMIVFDDLLFRITDQGSDNRELRR